MRLSLLRSRCADEVQNLPKDLRQGHRGRELGIRWSSQRLENDRDAVLRRAAERRNKARFEVGTQAGPIEFALLPLRGHEVKEVAVDRPALFVQPMVENDPAEPPTGSA